MSGPRACLRRRCPEALGAGPRPRAVPSALCGNRAAAPGYRGPTVRCSQRGRASLLVLLLPGQPCSAQRAGPHERRGAAGRSPHLRGGCDSERGGLGTAPLLRVRAQPEPPPYPGQVPTPPGRADRRHFVRAEAAVASPSPGQPAAARPRSSPLSFPSLLPSRRIRAPATAAGTGACAGSSWHPPWRRAATGSGEGQVKRAEGPLQLVV